MLIIRIIRNKLHMYKSCKESLVGYNIKAIRVYLPGVSLQMSNKIFCLVGEFYQQWHFKLAFTLRAHQAYMYKRCYGLRPL